MKILNLTQHKSTSDQNCFDLNNLVDQAEYNLLIDQLNFESCPSRIDIELRAQSIAKLAVRYFKLQINLLVATNDLDEAMFKLMDKNHSIPIVLRHFNCMAMIGGAPYLMSELEKSLKQHGIQPVYAFTTRASVESHNEDGSVSKRNVFKHAGYISA